jgi:outer membrane protein insertion porin family
MTLFLCLLFLLPPSTIVGEEVGKRIQQIEFQGNKSIEDKELIKVIETKIGTSLSLHNLRKDLHSLYSLGFFSDIKVDVKEISGGVKVTFILDENPKVSIINFVGNKKIKTERLRSEGLIREGDFFSSYKLKMEEERIRELYKKEGFYFVKIKSKLKHKREGMEIVFLIDEGEKIKIKKIVFKGAESISSRKLGKEMRTKKGSVLDERKLEEDLSRILFLYNKKGYAAASLTHTIRYDEERGGLVIEVELEEGPQFKVGKISFSGNTIFTERELRELMQTREEELYNIEKLQEDYHSLTTLYHREGYVEVEILPRKELNYEEGRINLSFLIREGERAFVERIVICGNTKTRDEVIRREILIYPGELLDGERIRISVKKLYQLGFFERVDVEIKEGTKEKWKVVVFEVEEGKTGTGNFGITYNPETKRFAGTLKLATTNLFGRGWSLSAECEVGFKGGRETYIIEFTEPWLLGTPTTFGTEFYYLERDERGYPDIRRGGSLKVGIPIKNFNKLYLKYRYREDITLGEDGIEERVSSVVKTFIRDTRDKPLYPIRGYRIDASCEFAGGLLGGEVNFYKPIAELRCHIPLLWKFNFAMRIRAGAIKNLQSENPEYYRFYVGGVNTENLVRGYEEKTLQPKDGAESVFVANIELRFPLSPPLCGFFFFDGGRGWEKPYQIDFEELDFAAGFGLQFSTPLGVMQVGYGYPLWSEESPKPYFMIGASF